MKRFLVKHVGNMGDLVFFVPPILETLKRRYPNSHITVVTTWGFKTKGKKLTLTTDDSWLPKIRRKQEWGQRNQGGFCIALMMTNPHVDQLVHWHDTELSLEANICCEEGQCFPTWNRAYYEQQKSSGAYDQVLELDIGIGMHDNPMQKLYESIGLSDETYSNYQLYFTDQDKEIAAAVMRDKPHPRIVILESLALRNTRGWDADKIPQLEQAIEEVYGVKPLWFGGKYIPQHKGQPLSLRQNIATLSHADVAIGVLSGPLHFAAAVGLPTITLWADQYLHRGAPAYFLNDYITDPVKHHRTILGPTPEPMTMLKSPHAPSPLTPAERASQQYRDWLHPGRQPTKAGLAPITVDEIMRVLHDMLTPTK